MNKLRIERAVKEILLAIGEDPEREGLLDTPKRVARMYEEIFSGIGKDPGKELHVVYNEEHDEMVVLKDIPFYSMCEHHLLPFYGVVHLGYIPNTEGRVVGISKLARVVEAYAKRLQIQEKLTAQIANTIRDVLQPRGVAVVIEAGHQCMTTRGVHQTGVSMVTSRMLGAFRDDPATRREFMSMIRGPKTGTFE